MRTFTMTRIQPAGRRWLGLLAVVAGTVLTDSAARAQGLRIRLDLAAAMAIPTIGFDRHGDSYLHIDCEQELALFGPLTVGVRGSPLFVYRQAGGATLRGLSFGLVNRVYQRSAGHSGVFAGLGVSTLWSQNAFKGNASRLNLVSQLSVGYQAHAAPWHVALLLEHISNANTAEPNHGVNGLALALGVSI